MIAIDLGSLEYYDSDSNQFIYEEGGVVRFEYTLKVVYDWEAKWRKPFLKGGLTNEETVDFYMRMALDSIEERFLSSSVMSTLANYISDDSTATTFTEHDDGQNGGKSPNRGKIHTAEELYALMFSAHVPIEWENRNLNRLLVILKIINSYNEPPKKMSQDEIRQQNRELNEKRRAQYNTKG